ncbi:periodic tryptophan protein 2 homolog isoform X3 [Nematostella vectensis]|uniref:periodic tryptophan protein 2 homolog isoform X3 n=1 Tax=Nematostella vectensis TaxID=45351 RepID=UPI0020776C2B|nr:periodic tryptophan protein 2 homolog isoform X3 [Nematostella vectensis]
MKKFSNLLGTVYKRGNVKFTNHGDCVISPVGNRVTVFDLKNNKSWTLPFENAKNIARLALSPDDTTIITVDEDGRSILANLRTKVALHFFNFKKPVEDIVFSPNGRFIAVTHGKHVQVWSAPGHTREFAPFVLHRTYTGHYDDTTCIDWSSDSRFFIVGSKDMTARIYSLDPMENFSPVTLSGARNTIVGCFFQEGSLDAYTISSSGALGIWTCSAKLQEVFLRTKDKNDETDQDKEELVKWKKGPKHFFEKENFTEITSCALHKATQVLIVGFSNGVFTIHELPDFNLIQTLSISQQTISAVAVNHTGEWLAFGCTSLGQLLVWEWQSESYILKQQGHYYDMNVLAYSPDGNYIATGGDDGKVKLWNTMTGFCFVTFHEHSASVTAVTFSPNGQVVLSASLDGTVRAFDLNRYRNFRTFASPRPAQFSTLALDSSGEVVAAGSRDTFEIFVWSIQTGRLLEVLAGHEAPVSSLAFSPSHPVLISGAWDKTVRLWNVFESKVSRETLNLTSDVVSIAVRPDGREVAISSLDGALTFWDLEAAVQVKSVDGRRDLGAGRKADDKITARSSAFGKCFTSLCYTADGENVLAGGRSKFVCIYNVEQQILLKRFQVSRNLSFDGMKEKLRSDQMTEAGPVDMIDDRDSDEEDISLPGVLKGDMSSRRTRPEIRVKCVQFSPTGRAWAAASTEGLLIYSLDASLVFDPYDLDSDVTPEVTRQVLARGEYARALVLGFRLNEQQLIKEVVESIKCSDIRLVVQALSDTYVDKLLWFVSGQLDTSAHLQFYLTWCQEIFTLHGHVIKQRAGDVMHMLRTVQKSLTRHHDELGKLCSSNSHMLSYLLSVADVVQSRKRAAEDDMEQEE